MCENDVYRQLASEDIYDLLFGYPFWRRAWIHAGAERLELDQRMAVGRSSGRHGRCRLLHTRDILGLRAGQR